MPNSHHPPQHADGSDRVVAAGFVNANRELGYGATKVLAVFFNTHAKDRIMRCIAGLATALVATVGVVACGGVSSRPRVDSSTSRYTDGARAAVPAKSSSEASRSATSLEYVNEHSGAQRCTGVHDEDYFPPPLTLQAVLDWSDFAVIGVVDGQMPAHLQAILNVPGTLNDFVVEKVLRTRGRIPVPKRVPWFSASVLDPTSGTFKCAEYDPAPLVGKRYLVLFYEVGGDFSAVRGSAATAALAIDDNQTLHSIASTLTDGKATPFGASRELDLMTLESATHLLVGMTQGPDPLAAVRASTKPQPSPPITAKAPGAIHNQANPPLSPRSLPTTEPLK